MINIKEEFLTSVKTRRAVRLGGSDAIVLWLSLKGYVAESNSGGFIPEDVIEDLPLLPRKWKDAMRALIECGKTKDDGERGPGLVESHEHGYLLHDYEDHGTPVEVEEERRRKAREQKAARRLLLRHQRGQCPTTCPHCVRGQAPDNGADSPADMTDKTDVQSADSPPRASGHAPVRVRAPARPQPNPALPSPEESSNQEASSQDLTGQTPSDERPPVRASELCACPPNLWEFVPEQTRQALDFLSIPRWAQEKHCRAFATRNAHRNDKPRTVTRWVSTWQHAMQVDWTDPAKRPTQDPEPDDETAARRAAEDKAFFERKRAEQGQAIARKAARVRGDEKPVMVERTGTVGPMTVGDPFRP